MKRQVLLSVLAAIAIFAVTSTAEAGMFGRLSLLRGGCSPCCEATCEPCEPVCCEPCEPVCDPCDPCCDPCGKRPFRPFGGFFANLKYKFAKKGCCDPCCDPCEPVCEPCEPICDPCEPICDPCETVCDPCGKRPFRPFGGFFANMKYKFAKKGCCDPCCDPCEPVCCNPCDACN